jgi:carboxylate-amine ligase
VIPNWTAFAEALAWGRAPVAFAEARWWWEARLHPVYGTVEVRVPDTQATVADTAAVASVIHALVATLGDRYEAGELPKEPAETWRIAENRWSACRYGIHGRWTDPRSGQVTPLPEYLYLLLDGLGPAARRHRCEAQLEAASDLIEHPRATLAREAGPHGHAERLAGLFAAA